MQSSRSSKDCGGDAPLCTHAGIVAGVASSSASSSGFSSASSFGSQVGGHCAHVLLSKAVAAHHVRLLHTNAAAQHPHESSLELLARRHLLQRCVHVVAVEPSPNMAE